MKMHASRRSRRVVARAEVTALSPTRCARPPTSVGKPAEHAPQPRRRRTLGLALAVATAFAGLVIVAPSAGANAEPGQAAQLRHAALSGPSIEIDAGYPYYKDRSAASIADEIAQNGYKSVHYFVTNEHGVDGDLVTALHKRGIAVWALTLAFGSYDIGAYPAQWPTWQQKLLSASMEGFYSFSPWSAGYLEFKKQSLAELVHTYQFDGVELAESFLPDMNGFTSGFYGDVGPLAAAAFQAKYGLAMPNFTDPSSALYFKTDTDRYAKWVQFRVDGVNSFLGDLVNGKGGLRQARHNLLIGSWSLAVDAGPDSVQQEREMQGIDAPAMIAAVKPDIHYIQTNWPDWIKPDLKPNYIDAYRPFIADIRKHNTSVPLGIQADIGSTIPTARNRAWLDQFSREASRIGFATWTGYEYSLGGYMYDEAPSVVTVDCSRPAKTVVLHFQKRIDVASAKIPESFVVEAAGKSSIVDPAAVDVDGNMVTLHLGDLPSRPFAVAVSHVSDTPSLWLFNQTMTPHTVQPGYSVTASCRAGAGL